MPKRVLSPSPSPEPTSTLFAPTKRIKKFHVLGSFLGRTRNSIYNLLEEHGATTTDRSSSDSISHIIVAENVWVREASSELVRRCKRDNKENAETYSGDPDKHRVWFLPLEWVLKSIEKEELQPMVEYDFEKKVEREKKARADELKAERERHHGQSQYARGERVRLEHERRQAEVEKHWAATSEEDDNATSEEGFDSASAASSSPGESKQTTLKSYWDRKPPKASSSLGWGGAGRGQTLGSAPRPYSYAPYGSSPSTSASAGVGGSSTLSNKYGYQPRSSGFDNSSSKVKLDPMTLDSSSEEDPELAKAIALSLSQQPAAGGGRGREDTPSEDYNWQDDSDVIVDTPPPKLKKVKGEEGVLEFSD